MSMRWKLISDTVEYITELGLKPYIIIQAHHVSCCGIPSHVVGKDGRVCLNISDEAARFLRIGIYQIQFDCRFGGEPATVAVAPEAVEAVYAHGADGPKLVLPAVLVEKQEKSKPTLRVVH